ncbi:MAG: hypothetical protein NXI35_38410 [bacterium]|nr:hypothetical protein [bacterium]
MPRRKQRPSGGSLSVEEKRKGIERLTDLRTPDALISDAAHHLVGVSTDRADGVPLRKQAKLMLIVGLLACAAIWAIKLAGVNVLELLGEQAEGWVVVVLAASSLTAYGALQLVFEKGEVDGNVETGGQFGGFVAASQEEGRWKRRLVAVGLGVFHTAVHFWI